jgi:hypothetical protein
MLTVSRTRSAHTPSAQDRDGVFFVVGTGRSGSTLLQAILSCHPRLSIPPEVRYFGYRDPAVRFSDPLPESDIPAYIEDCRNDMWWEEIGVPLDELEQALRAGKRSARDIFLWVLRRLSPPDAQRIGEKTPPHIMYIERILEVCPEAKIIHIHRDPRDVVVSYLSQYWCSDPTGLDVALYCRHCYWTLESLTEKYGPQTITKVRYESLVEQPESELRRLCAFLGEDFDPAMLSFNERNDAGFVGIEQSWKELTRKPLTNARIGRFTEKLSPWQIYFIETAMGDTLQRLGYEPTGIGRGRPDLWVRYLLVRLKGKLRRRLGLVPPLIDDDKVRERGRERDHNGQQQSPATHTTVLSRT